MNNKLTVILDDEVLNKLRDMFKDDEALRDFAVKAIKNELERCGTKQSPAKQRPEGLEAYLQSGKTGSRNYGIKGQGW